MTGIEWAQIDNQLRALWGEGLSTRLIGQRLGVSKNAVIGRAHRLRLPSRPHVLKHPNPVTSIDWATVRPAFTKLWIEGVPVRKMAAALSIGRDTISKHARRLGLPDRHRVPAARRQSKFVPPAKVAPASASLAVVEPVQPPAPAVQPCLLAPTAAVRLVEQPVASQSRSSLLSIGSIGPGPARSCQYPLTSARPWRFCGNASVPGLSYCGHHAARCFSQRRSADGVAA